MMKTVRVQIVWLMMCALFLMPALAHAGLGDILKGAQKLLETKTDSSAGSGENGELSEETIIKGLREALETGAANAVSLVSQTNGYLDNASIRIPLPEKVQKVEKLLKSVGLESLVDSFETSMNRAAEQAAPEAKAIFTQSITEMTFSDARKILSGADNEATLYFREKTGEKLGKAFKPIVSSTMSQVGVTRTWQELSGKAEAIPLVGSLSVNLDDYVTEKALDGLFLMLAEEEKKIRQDPMARATDLLKTVFSKK